MSEYFELPEDSDESESSPEITFNPDPATVAFLDQESAAFAEVADEFEDMYGFRHDCHCDKDYAEGRVGEVTECYAGMIVEALATCARLNHENQALKDMLDKSMEMNKQFIQQLAEADDPYTDEAESTQSDDSDRQ